MLTGILVAVIVMGAFYAARAMAGKNKRPMPTHKWGTFPIAEIGYWYTIPPGGNVFAAEAGKVWDLNVEPSSLDALAPCSHVVIGLKTLNFCNAENNRLEVKFNFMLAMIAGTRFNPNARPSDAPQGTGTLEIFTPSGRTFAAVSADFANAIASHVARAKAEARAAGEQFAPDMT